MHHADQQGTDLCLAVAVFMLAQTVFTCLSGMAVSMEMPDAVIMGMCMKVNAVTPQTPEHINAQPDQHDTNSEFQTASQSVADDGTCQNSSTCKQHQGDGMAKTPDGTMSDDLADA